MSTHVTKIPFASTDKASSHFGALLSLETDCWDVHATMNGRGADFVLIQASASPESFAEKHIPGAIHMPSHLMSEESLAEFSADTKFVVYCAGPHCNGADKAAVRLSRLGRSVKKMIGGIEGWKDEGFEFTNS